MANPLAAWAAGLLGSSGVAAAADATSVGPDYAGIAALIAACAGMVSAIGAIVIALLRKPSAPDTSVRDQLLLELLKDKLDEDRDAS